MQKKRKKEEMLTDEEFSAAKAKILGISQEKQCTKPRNAIIISNANTQHGALAK